MGKVDGYRQAIFLGSAQSLADCTRLAPPLPEVAVVGRSNVGKSSLLNLLFDRKGYAKISNTPGKTRLLNYFQIEQRLLLVDLPGYGYANVSKKVKERWSALLDDYLNARPILILSLFDLRRDPSPEDQMLVNWAVANEKPLLPIFTKVDKLTRGHRWGRARQIVAALNLPGDFILSSATERVGRNELIAAIDRWLAHREQE
jgi:GTP-binding protein